MIVDRAGCRVEPLHYTPVRDGAPSALGSGLWRLSFDSDSSQENYARIFLVTDWTLGKRTPGVAHRRAEDPDGTVPGTRRVDRASGGCPGVVDVDGARRHMGRPQLKCRRHSVQYSRYPAKNRSLAVPCSGCIPGTVGGPQRGCGISGRSAGAQRAGATTGGCARDDQLLGGRMGKSLLF